MERVTAAGTELSLLRLCFAGVSNDVAEWEGWSPPGDGRRWPGGRIARARSGDGEWGRGSGTGSGSQAGPMRSATILAERVTRGSPPPGWADPPTRKRPGTGERLAGRRKAARGPFEELP